MSTVLPIVPVVDRVAPFDPDGGAEPSPLDAYLPSRAECDLIAEVNAEKARILAEERADPRAEPLDVSMVANCMAWRAQDGAALGDRAEWIRALAWGFIGLDMLAAKGGR
jgi:hypothetical protein